LDKTDKFQFYFYLNFMEYTDPNSDKDVLSLQY